MTNKLDEPKFELNRAPLPNEGFEEYLESLGEHNKKKYL